MITKQLEIHVPYPTTGISELRLALASCRLTLQPGESEPWVTGIYDDLKGAMPLTVQQDGKSLRITQRETLAENLRLAPHLAPLDLALCKDRPFALHMEAGLLDGSLDLSGLPLTRLDLRHGDGKQSVQFASPNPQPMEKLNVVASVGQLEVRGLANANFARLKVESGETDCLLNFSGLLRHPAQGKITIPQGSVEILVPAATAARISAETLNGTVDMDGGFTRRGGAFWTQAVVEGRAPVLTLKVTVLVGALRLRTC